jgi:hypothetical protein
MFYHHSAICADSRAVIKHSSLCLNTEPAPAAHASKGTENSLRWRHRRTGNCSSWTAACCGLSGPPHGRGKCTRCFPSAGPSPLSLPGQHPSRPARTEAARTEATLGGPGQGKSPSLAAAGRAGPGRIRRSGEDKGLEAAAARELAHTRADPGRALRVPPARDSAHLRVRDADRSPPPVPAVRVHEVVAPE